jgi:predicted permease
MGRWGQEVRIALRQLWRHPRFSVMAIATLAAGLGTTITAFNALSTILLKPLPGLERPGELVRLKQGATGAGDTHSYPNYRDIRDRNTVLTDVAALQFTPFNLGTGNVGLGDVGQRNSGGAGGGGGGGANTRAWGYLASGNYFTVLGAQALLGRALTPDDDGQAGAQAVAVLSYAAWQRRFGGDPQAVGRTLALNGQPCTIVGVMPRDFRGTELFYDPEIWVPLAMQPRIELSGSWLERRDQSRVFVVGRLKPGVSHAQAEAALGLIGTDLARAFPRENDGLRITLSRPGLVSSLMRGQVLDFTTIVLGVCGLVLLIACSNLAGLLLVRGADRQREIAVRLACGAERRQLLTESLMLSLAGGAAGLLLAFWLTALVEAWRPPINIPVGMPLAVDWRVVAFALALCVCTTLLFGLAPALRATRRDVATALKPSHGVEMFRGWHLRDLLVGAQLALAVILLIASFTIVRGLQRAMTFDLGFNPQQAVATSFDLRLPGYNSARMAAFQQQLVARVSALPGVEAAALATELPLGSVRPRASITVEGRPVPPGERPPVLTIYAISPDYLKAMQTRLVSGRGITSEDRDGAPMVALVTEAFARRYLAGADPLRSRIQMGARGWMQVVGIVADGTPLALDEMPDAAIFTSIAQFTPVTATLVVRSPRASAELLQSVTQIMTSLDPAVATYDSGPLERRLDMRFFSTRLAAGALSILGLVAIGLAALGVYGVTAHAVARRTREIGIRLAVGAQGRDVLRLTLGRSGLVLIVSLAVGLLASVPLTTLLARIGVGVDSRDLLPFLLAPLAMTAVLALASWHPVRTAMRLDPVQALRDE